MHIILFYAGARIQEARKRPGHQAARPPGRFRGQGAMGAGEPGSRGAREPGSQGARQPGMYRTLSKTLPSDANPPQTLGLDQLKPRRSTQGAREPGEPGEPRSRAARLPGSGAARPGQTSKQNKQQVNKHSFE